MNNIIMIMICFVLVLSTNLFAEDISVQDQLDKQNQIINEQNKRIEELEKIIQSLIVKDKNNQQEISENNKENLVTEETVNNDEDQGDIAASSKGKIYNPEKAFLDHFLS